MKSAKEKSGRVSGSEAEWDPSHEVSRLPPGLSPKTNVLAASGSPLRSETVRARVCVWRGWCVYAGAERHERASPATSMCQCRS